MYKAYKFRMYLTSEQEILINKTFGCTRFIYNYFLDKCKKLGHYIKAFDMCKEIKELVVTYPWLKEVDSCALRCSVFNLEDSYKNFFAKRSDYPVFKSKFNKQSYRTNLIKSEYKGKEYNNIELDLINKTIKLPKLGIIKIRGYRKTNKINGNIINATIEKDTTGKYYASVIYEIKEETNKETKATSIVGIDLGIKDIVTLSDGRKYKNNKEIKKYEDKIKYKQQVLSRKEKGSNNYKKTKKELAVLYSKLKNARKHNIIEITNEIVSNYDVVVSEKLNVKGMLGNHRLAKNINDASFNKICERLKWKCKLLHKYYYQVDTYYPSSKICYRCGYKTNITNNLNIRKWECENCHNENDRDINASLNIMFEGLTLHYKNLLKNNKLIFN
jgi:putative transposase